MRLRDEELRARMMAEAEAAIDQMIASKRQPDEITLTEIEDLVRAAGQEVQARWTAELVRVSSQGQEVPGPTCSGCGQEMRYRGQKDRRVMTDTGEVQLRRGYYYCETCKRGSFPPG